MGQVDPKAPKLDESKQVVAVFIVGQRNLETQFSMIEILKVLPSINFQIKSLRIVLNPEEGPKYPVAFQPGEVSLLKTKNNARNNQMIV